MRSDQNNQIRVYFNTFPQAFFCTVSPKCSYNYEMFPMKKYYKYGSPIQLQFYICSTSFMKLKIDTNIHTQYFGKCLIVNFTKHLNHNRIFT